MVISMTPRLNTIGSPYKKAVQDIGGLVQFEERAVLDGEDLIIRDLLFTYRLNGQPIQHFFHLLFIEHQGLAREWSSLNAQYRP